MELEHAEVSNLPRPSQKVGATLIVLKVFPNRLVYLLHDVFSVLQSRHQRSDILKQRELVTTQEIDKLGHRFVAIAGSIAQHTGLRATAPRNRQDSAWLHSTIYSGVLANFRD